MPRIVTLHATGPIKIDPATWPRDPTGNLKNIWVCACGLSATFPICDKAHKQCGCENEDPALTYRYVDGVRYVVDPLAPLAPIQPPASPPA